MLNDDIHTLHTFKSLLFIQHSSLDNSKALSCCSIQTTDPTLKYCNSTFLELKPYEFRDGDTEDFGRSDQQVLII